MVSTTGKHQVSTIIKGDYRESWNLVMKSLADEVQIRKQLAVKMKRRDACYRVKIKKEKRIHIGKHADITFSPPSKKVSTFVFKDILNILTKEGKKFILIHLSLVLIL